MNLKRFKIVTHHLRKRSRKEEPLGHGNAVEGPVYRKGSVNNEAFKLFELNSNESNPW
jgi:hypothetical protein